MSDAIGYLFQVNAVLAYAVVFAFVFAEDALFVGFVIPGETAAVLGGVLASGGRVQLWLMMLLVTAAAILGDSVGYEAGRRFGPRILNLRILAKRRPQLEKAQRILRRRGGAAVFLGRFTAFFRAVMPGLAGMSRMPYGKFLAFNVAGGITWGIGFVLVGFLAGNSYEAVARTIGRDAAWAVAAVALAAVLIWHFRRRRPSRRRTG